MTITIPIDVTLPPGLTLRQYLTTPLTNDQMDENWVALLQAIENAHPTLPWNLETSTFTAVSNNGYAINSSAAVSVSLPASPNNNEVVRILDFSHNCETYNISVIGNGNNIEGVNNTLMIDVNGLNVELTFITGQGWIITDTGNSLGGSPYISFEQLSDSGITSPTLGQAITFNSSTNKWVNTNLALSTLSDTSIVSPTDGQVLMFHASTSTWMNVTPTSSGATHLYDLLDVGLAGIGNSGHPLNDTQVQGFQFLMWDTTTAAWQNATLTFQSGYIPDLFIDSPVSGQALVYDGTVWANTTLSSSGATHLYDLLDVNLVGVGNFGHATNDTQVLNFQFLMYDNYPGGWVNASLNLASGYITDVHVTSPSTNQVLAYNGTNWVNTPFTLASGHITDVQLTSPVVGQILSYNGTNWVNTAPSSGGSSSGFFSSGNLVYSVGTQGAAATSIITVNDNLYWAISNSYTGSSYNTNSHVYKVDIIGNTSTVATVATQSSQGTKLLNDLVGGTYWAVTNNYNGTTSTLTSYVYYIDSNQTLSTHASVTTNGAIGTDLITDAAANLYWAVANNKGTTSYIYKIDHATNTLTTFASVTTKQAVGTSLQYDSSSNLLYWAITNNHDTVGGYNQISYVYQVDMAGTLTTIASTPTQGAQGTTLLLNTQYGGATSLFWAVANWYDGSSHVILSYIYKIDLSNNTMVTYSTQTTNGASTTKLLQSNLSGNLYWAIGNAATPSAINSYIYEVTQVTGDRSRTSNTSVFATQSTLTAQGTDLFSDYNYNIIWAVANQNDASFNYNQTSTLTAFNFLVG